MEIISPKLLNGFAGLRVLVVGDLMLDRFIYGSTNRMSPEAPVPILVKTSESCMAGGAGNVARNIVSLGGCAHIVAAVGDDAAGARLKETLQEKVGITMELVVVPGRRTTEKIRYVSDRQQLLRVDSEDTSPIADESIVAAVKRELTRAHIVILSDYAKGLLTDATLKAIIIAARGAGIPVIADPKSSDIARYDGVTVLTPNRKEAALASDIHGEGNAETAAAAAALLAMGSAIGAVLITRGARGMVLAERGKPPLHIPSSAREVFDVSGAGDTVVAALALALAAGCELHNAVHVANQAAGIAVAKVGTATVIFDELITELEEKNAANYFSKIVTRNQAAENIAKWRNLGHRVGFTNGCFDLLHPGHISLISQARSTCQHLVVGLNTDASVKRLKGPLRPFQSETARAIVLASMQHVDLVVMFDDDTPLELISVLRPDVLVKGADYREDQVVGGDLVKSYGGEVVLAALAEGHSTTHTLARMPQG